jgi:adenylate cyclase
MKSSPTASQQLNDINQTIEQIRSVLAQGDRYLNPHLIKSLNALLYNLSEISRQTSQHRVESENLVALVEIGQVINSSLDLVVVLRIVMDNIIHLTGAERGFLMLKNETGELITRIARNWEKESVDSSEYALSRTIINQVVASGQAVLTTNALQDPRFESRESIIVYNLRSILCVPLIVKGGLIGVIYADNRVRSGIFKEAERELLTAFANQAAVAIENARLYESVRQTLEEVTRLKILNDNVFASITSGLLTTDSDNRITTCNRAAQEILGLEDYQLIGRNLEVILAPIPEEIYRHLTDVRQTNRSFVGLEFNYELPGRDRITLSISISPLKEASKGLAIVIQDLTERRRLEAQHRLFERMVSPAVINQLDPDQVKLGGRRAELAILFADIRGFTSFSEQIKPERLVAVLNLYLAAAAEAILAYGGTIDKFMGDSVMAWFYTPSSLADQTWKAVQAAAGIRLSVDRLKNKLPKEFHLSFGAGIHCGEVVVGLIGTEKRMDYTVIGDSVNTAKRIQEKAASGQILISETAHIHVARKVKSRIVESILAKGKSQPIDVYEILGLV